MKLNVLVVDDSAIMRTMVQKAVQMGGIPVNKFWEAANGKEGLEVLDREWIDLVLVDINMPVMGGLEMIEKMRDIPDLSDVAIVVISTESSKTRIDDIRKQGIAFIHKPFKPEEIRETISSLIGELQDAKD